MTCHKNFCDYGDNEGEQFLLNIDTRIFPSQKIFEFDLLFFVEHDEEFREKAAITGCKSLPKYRQEDLLCKNVTSDDQTIKPQ